MIFTQTVGFHLACHQYFFVLSPVQTHVAYIGLKDFLRIEKTSFYGYGVYVYEIADIERSEVIVVITPRACAGAK